MSWVDTEALKNTNAQMVMGLHPKGQRISQPLIL